MATAPSTPLSTSLALEAYRLDVVEHLQQVGAPVLLAQLGSHVSRPAALKSGRGKIGIAMRDILLGDARFQINGEHPAETLSLAGPAGIVPVLFALCVCLVRVLSFRASEREGGWQLAKALECRSRLEPWGCGSWRRRALLSHVRKCPAWMCILLSALDRGKDSLCQISLVRKRRGTAVPWPPPHRPPSLLLWHWRRTDWMW